MDISTTTAPRSDQQNYDDYVGGEKTVTIADVTAGNAEQPVEIHLVEFPGRPFKPSKSMRRVLVAAWGKDSSVYTGRRMTLYGDPTVKFGGQTVGGIRISHLSHIDQRLSIALTITRGKRSPYTVEPLPGAPTQGPNFDLIDDMIVKATTVARLDEFAGKLAAFKGERADQSRALVDARRAELVDAEGVA